MSSNLLGSFITKHILGICRFNCLQFYFYFLVLFLLIRHNKLSYYHYIIIFITILLFKVILFLVADSQANHSHHNSNESYSLLSLFCKERQAWKRSFLNDFEWKSKFERKVRIAKLWIAKERIPKTGIHKSSGRVDCLHKEM